MGAILGGVHKFTGQTKGQKMNPGRRGVQRAKVGTVGPTVVVTINHQSGGGGVGSAGAGEQFSLQLCSRGSLVHLKNLQKYKTSENQKFYCYTKHTTSFRPPNTTQNSI